MGIYATVIFVLGMTERLADLMDATVDPFVLDLDVERLPKRVRPHRRWSSSDLPEQPGKDGEPGK